MTPARRRLGFLLAALAVIAAVLAAVLPLTPASAAAHPAAGTRVGAHQPATILTVGVFHPVLPGQGRNRCPPEPGIVSGACVAAEEPIGLSSSESWGNPSTLADHFARHGADFGATSAEDYASQAAQFFQRALQEGLPTKIGTGGIIRVYDPASNTFGAYNASGTTRTFFKPSSPTYWDRQPGSPPWEPC